MSLNDIPGKVIFGRQLPLGIVLALAVGGGIAWATIHRNDQEIMTRLLSLEEANKARLVKDEARARADAEMAARLARIETVLDNIRELLRERRQPPL